MAEPRKVFRIEKTGAVRPRDTIADVQAPLRHAELMNEIAALRAAITAAAMRHPGSAGAPADAGHERLASELSLIVGAIDSSAINPPALPCRPTRLR